MQGYREDTLMKTWISASLVAGCVLASVAPAVAADPTQSDYDACNRAAQMAGGNPSASPQAGGTTGPSITTPSGTPDTTQGVQPGGTAGKTGPMITGTGRTPGSTGGVSEGTGAVSRDSSAGASTSGSAGQVRGMADEGKNNPAFKTAYQDCMKQRGF
jgi:hypothetical protein